MTRHDQNLPNDPDEFDAEHDYCGCCGTDDQVSGEWCRRCKAHVGTNGPAYDRTYRALNGTECPFQV